MLASMNADFGVLSNDNLDCIKNHPAMDELGTAYEPGFDGFFRSPMRAKPGNNPAPDNRTAGGSE